MMNLNQFSGRDLERLSAYLDGALNPGETAQLEARLRREPELRQALQTMRQMVGLLRSMPEVPVPRNFTLSPEMVGAPRRKRAYPTLQLATALVAAAFVFVIGLDVFGTLGMRPSMAPMVEREIVVEEAPAEAPQPEAAMKAPEGEIEPSEKVMDNVAQEVEPATGVPEPEAEGVDTTPQGEEALAAPSPAEEGYRAEEPQATSTPLSEGALGAAAPGTEEPPTDAGEDEEMEAPTEAASAFFNEEQPSETEGIIDRLLAGIGPLRFLQIGLGLGLILLIVANLSLRRLTS